MKILVFSDSHGNPKYLAAALREHKGTVDLAIHLGDGLSDMERAGDLLDCTATATVIGNGEQFFERRLWADVPDETVISPDGVRILCCHGHKYRVKHGLSSLAEHTEQIGADLVLFGHTHDPFDGWEKTPSGKLIRFFNPGSVGLGYPASYGIVETVGGKFITSHRFFD
ncbi:MAG: YfcE family phosphodiesterase [Clostridia bacterium]|nr:YfcE family phosphodiesterase [Clostridia bacterium]